MLCHYDPSREVILYSDASRLKGLRYVIAQVVDGQFKLIKCGSRFLLPAESKYSTTELEFLGIVWGYQKCLTECPHLTGMENFTVITDHRPLHSILNNQTLEQVTSPRIQRLKERLMRYNFTTEWRQGRNHHLPDALSRHPNEKRSEEDKKSINKCPLKLIWW